MGLNKIYAPIADDLEEVERCLQEAAQVDDPLLAELLKYAVEGSGKRLRPAFTLLCGKFYHYNPALLVPMAAAVELLHTATLVHDDIVDHSPVRRGKPTVSHAFGENRALLLGDYLFAKAGRLCADTDNLKVIKLFAQTLMTISGGEVRQTAFTFDLKTARDYYYSWISAKTACLFCLACESGAILGQSPEEAITAMRDYGHNLGMAFQIADDVLDFVGEQGEIGKPVGSDLTEGAVTLPSILYAESHPDDDIIKTVLASKDARDVARAVEKIKNSSSIGKCLDIASDFCSRACRAIEKLPDSIFRSSLVDLANYVITRRK
ncbi:MAG: polyprenyl synthetase family protein [Chloroflexi bacterium]|nr:polyprenyl synthetase family protein [Chloroflexota bacterium]MBM3174306.1 polyprenyl synthetase family protein [Chloroflexota bacterium]MBM4449437.1 polyprenyl synthetase family protein [Chloroflexota bacterium]